MASSGSWASASALPLLQRVATAVFFIAFLAWLDVLPIPWFEREADGVVSFNYHPLCMTCLLYTSPSPPDNRQTRIAGWGLKKK